MAGLRNAGFLNGYGGLYQPPFIMTGPARFGVLETFMMVRVENGQCTGRLVLLSKPRQCM